MSKRKTQRGNSPSDSSEDKKKDSNNDDLPLAIQIFLWRQTRYIFCSKVSNTESSSPAYEIHVIMLKFNFLLNNVQVYSNQAAYKKFSEFVASKVLKQL